MVLCGSHKTSRAKAEEEPLRTILDLCSPDRISEYRMGLIQRLTTIGILCETR